MGQGQEIWRKAWAVRLSCLALALGSAPVALAQAPTAGVQSIFQRPAEFVGKTVTILGEVDHILGPGSIVVRGPADSRILVFTNQYTPSATGSSQLGKNDGTTLKEKQKIKVVGKVAQLTVKNEMSAFDQQNDRTTIREVIGTTPVIVAQQGGVQPTG